MPLDPNTRIPIEGLPDNVGRVSHSGARQSLFFIQGNLTYKADIILTNPTVGLKAEPIEGVWYWVVGCKECLGEPKSWLNYHCCEEHDACGRCGVSREEAVKIPLGKRDGVQQFAVYGHRDGWRCAPCYEAEQTEFALARLREVEGRDIDHETTSEIVCPHCGVSYYPDHEPREENGVSCDTCGGEYDVTFEVSVAYTTTLKGERVTADTYKFKPRR